MRISDWSSDVCSSDLVVGIGDDAQPRNRVVCLARAEQAPGDLGRLAEADGQQAGGQRVEAAGMAGLACAEQVAHPLQRLVGTQAARLVEQQDAVEAAEPGTDRKSTRLNSSH